MNSTTHARDRHPSHRGPYPVVDLEWLFDDDDAPTEITVFSIADDVDPLTNWLTIDCEHAIDLDDAR